MATAQFSRKMQNYVIFVKWCENTNYTKWHNCTNLQAVHCITWRPKPSRSNSRHP